jgi:hypothetical protein|tara:strand:+ start:25650 stop:26045 length:396 start_codon:yes stop_codon:yes gene_type:complete
MNDPDTHLEYAQAEMPDGRILLIERERAPRLTAKKRAIVSAAFLPVALFLALLIGQSAPVFTFAGYWSFFPLIIAYMALSAFALARLMRWASVSPDDPETCKVVGMDCSTQELFDVASGRAAADLVQRSMH